jgi:hypothetical protein
MASEEHLGKVSTVAAGILAASAVAVAAGCGKRSFFECFPYVCPEVSWQNDRFYI